MSRLDKAEQAAIELVARRFSATWEEADGRSPDAYLTIAGKRIAVNVTAIQPGIAEWTRPHLRFDRVALGLVRRLRAGLSEVVPDGEAVVLTVTAPIRLPAKTIAALENQVKAGLALQPPQVEIKAAICGNQVRARLLKGGGGRMPKIVGFVHNPESDAELLLGLTQRMLQTIGAAADRPPPAVFIGDRWLVVANEDGPAHIETYRQIYSQLSMSTDFNEVLMVLAGGRVESL
jgi:hypothetical protein